VPFKDVAAAIGRSLTLPVKSVSAEEAAGHKHHRRSLLKSF